MKQLLVITGDCLGRGDDELGSRLMVKFIHQLGGTAPRPDGIVFYNTGVRLLGPDSVVQEALVQLEHDGVELVACGTCVQHFGMTGRTAAGRVSDMREIVTLMNRAERVVTV